MKSSTHTIKLPYGGNIAQIWKNQDKNYYAVRLFNPKKIRRLGGRYLWFTTWLKVKEYIRSTIKNHFDRENIKASERVAAKAAVPAILATYQKGDVLYASWGWEQTNIEFVQVVGISSSRLIVRAISGNLSYTGDMSGKVKPEIDNFIGPVFYLNIRPFGTDGNHCARGSYVTDKGKIDSANHWSRTTVSEEHYCSWYA